MRWPFPERDRRWTYFALLVAETNKRWRFSFLHECGSVLLHETFSPSCIHSVVVITSALHAEGPRFDPGWMQLSPFFRTVFKIIPAPLQYSFNLLNFVWEASKSSSVLFHTTQFQAIVKVHGKHCRIRQTVCHDFTSALSCCCHYVIVILEFCSFLLPCLSTKPR